MFFKRFEEVCRYADTTEIKSSERLMILVGEKSAPQVDSMMEYLNQKGVGFFGGIYPRILVGSHSRSEGFLVQKLEPMYCSIVFPFMMRFKLDPESLEGSTALVLVDGLSSKMKDLTDTLQDKVGKKVKYVGGGAGFYDLIHRPCIFDNKGMYKDALYTCIVKADVDISIEHGWNKLEGPFFVKKSVDNVLSQLDDGSAFDVYKFVIEEEERITLFREDFFLFAKDHPFGILQEDGTVIVRDPISLNEKNEIICVANIPAGSDVFILKGDAETLLNSSRQIAEKCAENAPTKYLPLLFDCISRSMFLEERFETELDNIQSRLKYTVEGALSIGEIASKSNGELVIHNKSSVLALLHEE